MPTETSVSPQHDPEPSVGEVLINEMSRTDIAKMITCIEDKDKYNAAVAEVLPVDHMPLHELGYIGENTPNEYHVNASLATTQNNNKISCFIYYCSKLFHSLAPRKQGYCLFGVLTLSLFLYSVLEPALKYVCVTICYVIMNHYVLFLLAAAACVAYVHAIDGQAHKSYIQNIACPQAENIVELMSELNDSAESLAEKELPAKICSGLENAVVKYGSTYYNDDEVQALLNNLKSPRPFIQAKLDNIITETTLLDSGASVNLIAVSVVDDAARHKNRSYKLYRSSAVVSGVGAAAPPVHGVIILPVILGKVDIGPVPFLVVDKVTESTRVLLGCKSLCKINMTMQFKPDNTIVSTMDLHGQKSRMPIELLPAETYNVYLCEDFLVLPGQARDLSVTTDKSAPPILKGDTTLLQVIPHAQIDKNIDICSLAAINPKGNITVRAYNKTDSPISLCKHTEIGLCSHVDPEVPEIMPVGARENDKLALANDVLTKCPCFLPRKIFFASPDGSTGFEPKFSLLSPYSSKPPEPGLQMLEGNIYIVPSRRTGFRIITREMVQHFCKIHKIYPSDMIFVVYFHPSTINGHTGQVLAKFVPLCKLGIRKAARQPESSCLECSSFWFHKMFEPRITYPFREIILYVLASAKAPTEKFSHVKDAEEFCVNLHSTNFHIF